MARGLAVILGIRPDIIRASLILRELRSESGVPVTFIWSGQHYSDNLKDIFFRELRVAPPEVELGAGGETDAEITASVIARLYPVLERLRPGAAVFLGDTHTVMGCIAAAQLNIPIVHIEGCMRSYDWRMPEEKYRTVSDHLSDVVYAYLDEYRVQGIAEGLNPQSIVVVGNPIVDVLQEHYVGRRAHFDQLASDAFFRNRGLQRGRYLLMTCHRRENVEDRDSLGRIVDLAERAPFPIYFPAGYRTQRMLARYDMAPGNAKIVDPIGYEEFLVLLTNAVGVLTDSGTVVEEACILGIPAVQMRRSTERPQVYDVGAAVKFDPSAGEPAPPEVFGRLGGISGRSWRHPFGDGRSSQRIVADLLGRLRGDGFDRHRPPMYHLDISRSYRSDEPSAPHAAPGAIAAAGSGSATSRERRRED